MKAAADSDQSKADGSFCIRYIRPGKYVLTAERLDAKDYIGWAGYYPGVAQRSQARTIEIHGGDNLAVDAPERDALAYHLTQTRNINGEFPAGYVPPGNYLVQTYVRPDLKTGKIPAELLRWRMARREMYIGTDLEIVLTLSPAN